MKLSELEPGSAGIIDSLNQDQLSIQYIHDLLDYGFFPGSKVIVLQKFNSEDKLIARVGQVDLSLRISDADSISLKA